MIFAVIPAAGKSTRMGSPKLALRLGDKCVLEHVIAALQQAGVERTVVVLGPHVLELVTLASSAGAEVCLLEEHTAEMRETVLRALAWLEAYYHPTDQDGFLLVPAD